MKESFNNISGGIKFLFAMIAIYAVLFLANPSFTSNSFSVFIKEFIGLIPMLVFFFFVIFIINYFLNPEIIKRHLGSDSGLKGWLYALLGSILISSPPYVVFPMLKELKKHGMKYSLIALFMNNRNVQPAFLPVMVFYFGLSFTVVISIYILIFAVLNAVLLGKIMDEKF